MNTLNPGDNASLALFSQLPDAVLALNTDGSVHAANRAAEWLGREGVYPNFAALTGVPWSDSFLLPVGVVQGRGQRLCVTSASGVTKLMQATLIAVAGDEREPVRCLCILRDVDTEIEAARTQLQATSRVRAAGSSAVMIWMADTDMRYDWFNAAWLAFTGRSLGQELAEGWQAGIHPEDSERCLGIHAASLQAQLPFSLDYRLRRHDGDYRWLLCTGIPRFAKSGVFEGYIGTCLDIQERKQMEERLADHARALRTLDARRESFLAVLSHELRNPLAPIANAAAILRRHEGDNPALMLVRGIIERQVEELRRLTSDLVDVSRITRGKIVLERERVVIGDAVRAAADRVQALCDAAGHTLVLSMPEEPIVCSGDNARLEQALLGLLVNAARFSAPGGRIEVSVASSDARVEIHVRDHGQGIRAEFMPRLFDLFARDTPPLEHVPGGIGVGLTIGKHIAVLHGGTLTASSEGPGRGAEFVLSLPLLGAEPVLQYVDPSDLSALSGHRVLVIEDNADMRHSMRLLLESANNDVRCAADGTEGLALLGEFVPQVVVCDIGLPGLDGFRLIPMLREKLKGQPVLFIALTGYGRDVDRDHAIESGFDLFKVKPLNPSRPAQH